MNHLEKVRQELMSHFAQSREWLSISQTGESFALTADEIEVAVEREKMLLNLPTARGFQTWRVTNYKFENNRISFVLSRKFGAEKTKLEFVSRVSAGTARATIEFARLEKTNEIARLIIKDEPAIKLVRVALKGENERLAQIFLENGQGAFVLALYDVSETLAPERILTIAVLEFEKLSKRKKSPVQKIRILATKRTAQNLQKLAAMLGRNWRWRIEVFEIVKTSSDDPAQNFQRLSPLSLADVRGGKPPKISTNEKISVSCAAQKIVTIAPTEIDALTTGNGETLRFHGLPFARVRTLANKEKVWFGIENKQRILSEDTAAEFSELVENLKIYRRFDSPGKRHAFYTSAPEAWLESILRRDIKQLDKNLILSPIHHQFRAGRDRLDLLALRRDGRLAIIEVKTSPDREMIFQSLDYWRKIENARHSGSLQKAKIFGELPIKNESALIYLVAPLLDFHQDFKFLARQVAPEIEIYRFDLNQNWREELKIVRREKATQ